MSRPRWPKTFWLACWSRCAGAIAGYGLPTPHRSDSSTSATITTHVPDSCVATARRRFAPTTSPQRDHPVKPRIRRRAKRHPLPRVGCDSAWTTVLDRARVDGIRRSLDRCDHSRMLLRHKTIRRFWTAPRHRPEHLVEPDASTRRRGFSPARPISRLASTTRVPTHRTRSRFLSHAPGIDGVGTAMAWTQPRRRNADAYSVRTVSRPRSRLPDMWRTDGQVPDRHSRRPRSRIIPKRTDRPFMNHEQSRLWTLAAFSCCSRCRDWARCVPSPMYIT